MIDNTIIVEIDMPNEIDVDLGDAKFITAPEKQVPQAVPQIDVDNNGLITATSVQEAGSVRAGTTKSIYQLAVEQGKTISPSGESQVAIEKGRFAVGDIVVSPLKVQEKELNVTDGGNYEVVPDNDYLLSKVGVNVDISAKVDAAFEAGKQAEYDAFWDAMQGNGAEGLTRVKFWDTWNDKNFKPKYDIYANTDTFTNGEDTGNIATNITDLRPETIGVNIYWHLCTGFNFILRRTAVKYIGVVDMTNATSGWCLFLEASELEYVEKVILPPKYIKNITFKTHGFWCVKLKEIRFENYFYANVEFDDCKLLSHESLISILNALYDYTNGDLEKGDKVTVLKLGSTNLAKLTSDEIAIGTQKGWEITS